MNQNCWSIGVLLLLVGALGCRRPAEVAQNETTGSSEIAQSSVDAQSLLNASLEKSRLTGKRVLVHLSSPNCAPCRLLEQMLHENSALFENDFIVLGIDQATMLNGQNVMKMVGSTGSTPWVAILDSDGNVIADSLGPNGNVGYPSTKADIEHFAGMIEHSMIKPNAITVEKIRSLFPSIPEAAATPTSNEDQSELKERKANAGSIAAMAVQAFFERTGKWPSNWDDLDSELVAIFDQIRDARSKIRDLSDPFARGLDFSEESQSLVSRLPDLSGFGPSEVRNHVDVDFAYDPAGIDETTNWHNFRGIKPHEPSFNVYRVEFTKLILSLRSGGTAPETRSHEAK